MGMLKELLRRGHHAVGETAEDSGPKWQPLPDLDLRDVRTFGEDMDWAEPSSCPSCGAAGYLDRIDIERRITSQHCPWCWTKWEVAADEA